MASGFQPTGKTMTLKTPCGVSIRRPHTIAALPSLLSTPMLVASKRFAALDMEEHAGNVSKDALAATDDVPGASKGAHCQGDGVRIMSMSTYEMQRRARDWVDKLVPMDEELEADADSTADIDIVAINPLRTQWELVSDIDVAECQRRAREWVDSIVPMVLDDDDSDV
eukprot:TRINITY_DN25413_c0_g1_i1.p2 TRINITY_DN25413_c0_g1~~TRINITY_DN25413_c0_g1_i1.p2  ORF type:complete len:168 (+),score=36.77 TRINITY_DN25413_c0_g1_i1:76-579(+)